MLGDENISALDLFLSTPSARRATSGTRELSAVRANFYPRPPRGGRQVSLTAEAGAD